MITISYTDDAGIVKGTVELDMEATLSDAYLAFESILKLATYHVDDTCIEPHDGEAN